MKAFDVVGDTIYTGIPVHHEPYPRIILGRGGHKRATWIPLGKRDVEQIVSARMVSCPARGKSDFVSDPQNQPEEHICEKCGEKYGDWQERSSGFFARYHPDKGMIPEMDVVHDIGVIALKDKESGQPNGRYLIVAPKNGADNRILVLWRVSSGYRGSATISADSEVTVLGRDQAWHSGRGAIGSTAEVLAVLKPGQRLTAQRSGRRIQKTHALLEWDGKNITVKFGDESLMVVQQDDPEGDYI